MSIKGGVLWCFVMLCVLCCRCFGALLCCACFAVGVVPMLAAPGGGSNDNMLQDAVTAAANRGLVHPNDHVVCVMSIKDSLVVKVVTMDGIGARCMRHTNSAQGVNHDSSTFYSQPAHSCAVGAVLHTHSLLSWQSRPQPCCWLRCLTRLSWITMVWQHCHACSLFV